MDIQHLVDRLEDLIDEGRHMPFSKFTMIDEERALEIIDQMRISIPEEVEKAARVLAQRDRILAQANEEAARLVQIARERGEQMIDRESMVQAAQARASQIIEEARQEADAVRAEADDYARRSLARLEQQLMRMLNVLQESLSESDLNSAPAPTPVAPPAPAPQPVQFVPPPQRQMVDVSAAPNENNNAKP